MEFDGLSAEAQGLMLRALQATVENAAIRFTASELASLGGFAAVPAGCMGNPSDPVARALGIQTPKLVSGPTVGYVRRTLLSWGIVRQPRALHAAHAEMVRPFERQGPGFSASDRTVVKPEPGAVRNDWRELRPIGVADLRLFEVSTGRVLTGTLVVDPVASVGVTTLLEDDAGAVVQLGLYNALPGGVTGREAWAAAQHAFPKGTALSIAEPFCKIFLDGNRGVRVDSPGDLRVGALAGDAARADALIEAGAFAAAAAALWGALREGGAAPARLLANRAQAFLRQRLYASAAADAAAALLLDPHLSDAWRQYTAAALGLGQPAIARRAEAVRDRETIEGPAPVEAVRAVLEAALALEPPAAAAAEAGAASDGVWEAGNSAYAARRYGEAAAMYTSAMAAHPAVEAAAMRLERAALCALRTNALHDAVAAACAGLRLRPARRGLRDCLGKSLVLLGETAAADLAVAGAPALQAAVAKTQALLRGGYTDVAAFFEGSREDEPLASDWIAPCTLEIANLGAKGRGVRATRDIRRGEVLLVQRARISASCAADGALTTDLRSRSAEDAPSVQLRAAAVHATASDGLLGRVLGLLYDGSGTAARSLPAWDDLLHVLGGYALPLLRQHPEYLPPAPEPSSDRIARVLHLNCHGEREAGRGSSELYPAVSTLNHSSRPTCRQLRLATGRYPLMALVADLPIPKGYELTVLYHPDARVVEQKWGIQD